jgi:hypothetical protein
VTSKTPATSKLSWAQIARFVVLFLFLTLLSLYSSSKQAFGKTSDSSGSTN